MEPTKHGFFAGNTHIHRVTTFVSQWAQRWTQYLTRPVDASTLGAFRIVFGLLMMWEIWRYYDRGWIARYYIDPGFNFAYDLFPFITPLPPAGMYALFAVMIISAFCIMIGLFYRASATVLFLAYTYTFLLEKSRYNNHYYLIVLLLLLLVVTQAHRWASIDQRRNPRLQREVIPFWNLFIFRMQMVIVYFYGGFAKINPDWLAGEPMRNWLAKRADYPVIGSFLTTPTAPWVFSYGGLLFDLAIAPFVIWRRTRVPAVILLVGFHLMNNWIFTIGVFPFLAMGATILFFEPDWVRRRLLPRRQRASRRGPRKHITLPTPRRPRRHIPTSIQSMTPTLGAAQRWWSVSFVSIYLLIQIMLPLRHWMYSGNVSWTEQGRRFSWHMKLRDKSGDLTMYVTNPTTQQTTAVDMRTDLGNWQIRKMRSRPDMIVQYAHHVRDQVRMEEGFDPIITVDAQASLNGRIYQPFIDPTVDLAVVPRVPLAAVPWILPMEDTQLGARWYGDMSVADEDT